MSQSTAPARIIGGTVPGTTLAIETADSFLSRGIGLLGRRGLSPGVGLLIRPCSSVHTFGMRFAIDVVYLDREGTVTKVAPRVRPWRFSHGGRRAHSTVELAAGEASRLGLVPGARIDLESTGVR